MAEGEDGIWVTATQWARGLVPGGKKERPVKVDPDEFLQRALAEWPLFDQLVARFYVRYQQAVDDADKAAKAGSPGVGREVGYAASLKFVLAWMTKYAHGGRTRRRAQTKG